MPPNGTSGRARPWWLIDTIPLSKAAPTAIGAVGLDWQVQGFGDFNGDGTDDMMLRNKSTGTFETYDIKGGSTRLVSCDGGCR